MRVFSINIKNYVFRTNTKIKIQSSCVPVKCFLMKSVKQDNVITRAKVFFCCWKVCMKCFKKICYSLRISAVWPCSVRIITGSEHTTCFWRLWLSLQAHVPDWWQEYISWIDPYERSIFKNHYMLGCSGVQWGIYG